MKRHPENTEKLIKERSQRIAARIRKHSQDPKILQAICRDQRHKAETQSPKKKNVA